MSQKLYEIYRRETFQLAATAVFKHESVAVTMNQDLIARGKEVLLDVTDAYDEDRLKDEFGLPPTVDFQYWFSIIYKETWRYYKNITGQYHPVDNEELFQQQYVTLKTQYADETVGSFENPDHYRFAEDPLVLSPEYPAFRPVLNVTDFASHMYVLVPRELRIGPSHPNPPVPIGETIFLNVPVKFDLEFVNDPVIHYEYRYGTLFHDELIKRYPNYEVLLNGILNPVDLLVALDANEGDLLFAGDYFRRKNWRTNRVYFTSKTDRKRSLNGLVEDNEVDILYDIEDWVRGFIYKYHNVDFMITDDLYLASFMGILYMNLPQAIMNIRLANCKSPKAHSYHIRQYLESHGELSQYIPLLSKKQSLYLYRNVKYLQANAGKRETFEDLIQNILTESRISLYGYKTLHNLANLKTIVTDLEDAQTGLTPEVQLRREVLNFETVGSGGTIRTVEEILNKEIPLARDGAVDLDLAEIKITEQLANSPFATLDTKVLETVALDFKERQPFKLSDVLMNYWIYSSFVNAVGSTTERLYVAPIFFTQPGISSRIRLSPRDALILFFYVFNKGHCNIELEYLPKVGARLIPRQRGKRVKALHETLTTLPPAPWWPYNFKNLVDRQYISDDLLITIRDNILSEGKPNQLRTPADFYQKATTLYDQLVRRYRAYVSQEHKDTVAYAEYAVMSMYWHEVPCDFGENETLLYTDWLAARNLDFTGLTPYDFRQIAEQLILAATGADVTSESIKEIQQAAVRVMRQFTSYTVQFIETYFDGGFYVIDWRTTRLGDIDLSVSDTQAAEIPISDVVDMTGYMNGRFEQDADIEERIIEQHLLFTPQAVVIDENPGLSETQKYDQTMRLYIDHFNPNNLYGSDVNSFLRGYMNSQMDLDLSIRQDMRANFNTSISVNIASFGVLDLTSTQEELLTVIPQNVLDGFDYPPP